MNVLKKRSFAACFLIVIIVVSSILSAHIQLQAKSDVVERIFYDGIKKDGLSIFSDLKVQVESAKNMVEVIKRNGTNNEKEVADILDTLADFNPKATIPQLFDFYQELTQRWNALLLTLNPSTLDENQSKLFYKYKTKYDSATNTIKFDPYNSHVREYKEQTDTFLAKFFISVTNVSEAEFFE